MISGFICYTGSGIIVRNLLAIERMNTPDRVLPRRIVRRRDDGAFHPIRPATWKEPAVEKRLVPDAA